jgi:hypothetical protein
VPYLTHQDLKDALRRDGTKLIICVSRKAAGGDVGVALAADQRVVLFHEVSGLTH